MLEGLPSNEVVVEVHRLRQLGDIAQSIEALGTRDVSRQSILAFLRENEVSDSAEAYLDIPFRAPLPARAPSRFSDGTHHVFYSAEDIETAVSEVAFHYLAELVGNSTPSRKVYFRHFQCEFDGRVLDLRPHQAQFPFLADPDVTKSYPPCNSLAKEAIEIGMHAFLTPSARRPGGTCVPVFSRPSLRNGVVGEVVALQRTHEGGSVVRVDE